MAQLSANKCSVCEENIAKQFCYECKHFLCDVCRKSHEKFPATKKHTVVNAGTVDKSALNTNLFCEKHKLEFIHFCEDCECLTCRFCDTTDHKSHLLKDVADIADSSRGIMRGYVQHLQSKVGEINDTIGEIKSVQMKRHEEEHERYKEEVRTLSEFFHSVITMVTDINMTRASDVGILNKEHMKNSISQLQSVCSDYELISKDIEQVLRESHDVTFYILQKALVKKFKELEEIPKTVEPQQLEEFEQKEFILSVIEKIQEKYDISYLETKEKKMELKDKKAATNERTKDSEIQQIVDAALQKVSGLPRIMMTSKKDIFRSSTLICVVAINIGTTTRLAYSLCSDYQIDPMDIRGTTDIKRCTLPKSDSIPTAILLDKSLHFLAFGYEAQEKYRDLVELNEHHDYYYFTECTSALRDRQPLTTITMIKDREGRELPLQYVISMVIQYLANGFFESLRIGDIRDDEVQWVLTIPISVQDKQRQLFMEAAQKAGLGKEQLSLCLEPAAAYLYCKHDQQRKLEGKTDFEKCILINFRDTEDTHVDITCMKRKDDGILEELLSISVDSAGYTTVREAFYRFIIEIVGEKVFQEFCRPTESINLLCRTLNTTNRTVFQDFQQQRRHELFNLQREFNKSIYDLPSGRLAIKLPGILLEMWKDTIDERPSDVIKRIYNEKVRFAGDKIRIDKDLFLTFFNESKSRIIECVEKLLCLEELRDVSTLLAIGTLAKCVPIQRAIKEAFPEKEVIIPTNPDFAVTGGAVLFGYEGC